MPENLVIVPSLAGLDDRLWLMEFARNLCVSCMEGEIEDEHSILGARHHSCELALATPGTR
jgi:hypothetical protein